MADDPIKVSSTAWTGLPTEPPPLSPLLKNRPLSPLMMALLYLFVLIACAPEIWALFETGALETRRHGVITPDSHPVAFGMRSLGAFAGVILGAVGLGLSGRDLLRKWHEAGRTDG